jgi:glutaminase
MTDKHDLKSLASSMTSVASPFRNYLNELYENYQSLYDGFIADYIPELASANPNWFGICVATVDGKVFEVGNCHQLFTIQSISKALTYGLALEDNGREYVNSKVSVETTGEIHNSIVLDEKTKRPYNPIVNAGAIATADLIQGNGSTDRLKRILDMFRRYTGRELSGELNINVPAFLSAKAAGNRHRAMAYLMLSFGIIGDNIEETLDLYFQQSSIMINTHDLAMIGATLANGGINPITGERAIDELYVQDVISVMLTCGMYDASGEWAYKVGMPASSGVSGGITALVPGKLGIGVFSPLLDHRGNSLRGTEVCSDIAYDFGLHLFNVAKPKKNLQEWIEGDNSLDSW